jgi:hypothetical protein
VGEIGTDTQSGDGGEERGAGVVAGAAENADAAHLAFVGGRGEGRDEVAYGSREELGDGDEGHDAEERTMSRRRRRFAEESESSQNRVKVESESSRVRVDVESMSNRVNVKSESSRVRVESESMSNRVDVESESKSSRCRVRVEKRNASQTVRERVDVESIMRARGTTMRIRCRVDESMMASQRDGR